MFLTLLILKKDSCNFSGVVGRGAYDMDNPSPLPVVGVPREVGVIRRILNNKQCTFLIPSLS